MPSGRFLALGSYRRAAGFDPLGRLGWGEVVLLDEKVHSRSKNAPPRPNQPSLTTFLTPSARPLVVRRQLNGHREHLWPPQHDDRDHIRPRCRSHCCDQPSWGSLLLPLGRCRPCGTKSPWNRPIWPFSSLWRPRAATYALHGGRDRRGSNVGCTLGLYDG